MTVTRDSRKRFGAERQKFLVARKIAPLPIVMVSERHSASRTI